MIRKFAYGFTRWLWHYKEIRFICVIGMSLFFLLSLLSYNSVDRTWFSYSTIHSPVHNWCGIVGAHVAALFFFCWGAAAFLFVVPGLFYIYVLYKNRPWCYEWDRFVLLWALPWLGACLLYIYNVDPIQKVPGGFIGRSISRTLYQCFEYVGTFVLLHTFLLACLVIIFRAPIFEFLQGVMHRRKFWLQRSVFAPRFATIYTRAISFVSGIYVRIYSYLFSSTASTIDQYGYDIDELDQVLSRDTQDAQSLEQFYHTGMHSKEQATSTPMQDSGIIPAQSLNGQSIDHSASFSSQEVASTGPLKPYALPDVSIFIGVPTEQHDNALMHELEKKAVILQEKLERFGVHGKVTAIKRGPVVTLYEYQPHIDTKISKIMTLEDDLALALQALSIRIIAPIPGKSLVGFEVANKQRKNVSLSSLIKSDLYNSHPATLPLILGEDTIGAPIIIDLARMPHLLIGGSTGSGKSVALNAMLISLLCKKSPDEVKLILIDPKRLEFAPYADIAHLLFPVITDPRQAAPVLRWVVAQMEERYEVMARVGARNAADYQAIYARRAMEEQLDPMPSIVVVIDELADLMMTAGREIEDLIIRITQMARAAGIHLIAATQRPSVHVITGLIKVNFPSRISFRVTSKVDSRTILDCVGADKLLGAGDMLFMDSSDSQLKRVHGAYVSDREIAQVTAHIKSERPVKYLDLKMLSSNAYADDTQDIDEELYKQILLFLNEIDEVSISLLQRRFRIGYNRSARIIDKLEAQGIISSSANGRTRKVIR